MPSNEEEANFIWFLYQSEVQDENLLLIVVFDFLDAQKTPTEKVATN